MLKINANYSTILIIHGLEEYVCRSWDLTTRSQSYMWRSPVSKYLKKQVIVEFLWY